MKNKIIITIVLIVVVTCALLLVLRSKNITSSNAIINQNGLENTEGEEESSPNKKTDINETINNPNKENNVVGTEPENNAEFEETKEPDNDSNSITNNQTEQTNDTSTTSSNNKDNKFKVVFKDYDGNVLKTEEVKKGKNAVPPNTPKRKGFIFEKWNVSYENVQTDVVTTAIYKEITKPTLILETTSNKNEIVVKVFIHKNPGLLALVINNTYDEDFVSLEKFESGEIMRDYVFTSPKNKKPGCNFAWNINEVPEEVEEGEVLTLYYEIKKPINTSLPPVSIACYDGAFDKNYELVDFEIIN